MLSEPLPPRCRPKNALRYVGLLLGEDNFRAVTLRIIWPNFCAIPGAAENRDTGDLSIWKILFR